MKTAVFERRTDVAATKHIDGITIRNPSDGAYFALNATGAFVWELLDQPTTIDRIKRVAMERFDVSGDSLATELELFMSTMLDAKLVTLKGADDAQVPAE